MSLEKNKRIVRRMIEAFNKRDLASLDKSIASDYFDNYHQSRGLEEYKKFLTMLLKAFPDWHEDIVDIVAEGEKVWYRFRATATHTSEYHGYLPSTGKKITLAPTGEKITVEGIVIYRIVNGKIAEGWEVSNLLDLYKQLGVFEYK
jgi:predicted ester cyclase